MVRAGLLAIALLLRVTSVPAQTAPDADVEAAGRIVLQQLEAFRRDDFDSAFGFASAEIHEIFDRARFETMVRESYPEIARSVFAVIDGSRPGPDSRLYLLMRVRGANGRGIEAVYEMVREGGQWRINGVVTRPSGGEKI
jgi:hypothetical protein